MAILSWVRLEGQGRGGVYLGWIEIGRLEAKMTGAWVTKVNRCVSIL